MYYLCLGRSILYFRAMPKAGRVKCDDSEVKPQISFAEPISAERLISNIVNAIFTVFPKIGKKLNKKQACQMLTLMNVSGMLQCDEGYIGKDMEFRERYADTLIKYELDIRSIARSIGIKQNSAVKFMRACFKANRGSNLYPYLPNVDMIWPSYELLVIRFGEILAQYITESIVGISSAKEISHRFPIFNRVSKNVAHASSATFFILEGCNYVAMHDNQTKERAPGQSERIFIDEFIDYLREMDEDRYLLFQDEIAGLLSNISDSFTPDCGYIIGHLDMEKFDEDVACVRAGFEKILKTKKPEPEESDAVTDAVADEKSEFPVPASPTTPRTGGIITLAIPVGGELPPMPAPQFILSAPQFVKQNKKLSVRRKLKLEESDQDDSEDDDGEVEREGNYGENSGDDN